MKKLKTIVLFLGVISTQLIYGQTNHKDEYDLFANKFRLSLSMPSELMRNCKPTACLLKVETDSQKKIINTELSDSADSLLIVEFRQIKGDINFSILEEYLKSEYGADNTCNVFIIPLTYAMYPNYCSPQVISIVSLYGYSSFSKKPLLGKVIYLDPIYTETAVQR